MIKAAEEKKALAAALAAKKSKAANKGKGKKDDAPAEEEEKRVPDFTIESEDGDYDLNNPEEFAKALAKECPRPFTFGPIEFSDLNMSEAE